MDLAAKLEETLAPFVKPEGRRRLIHEVLRTFAGNPIPQKPLSARLRAKNPKKNRSDSK